MDRIWRDEYRAMTTDRNVKIKIFLEKGYSFCDERDKDLQKYLPCVAVVDQIIGDNLYRFTMLTEDGFVKSAGYATAMPLELFSMRVEEMRSSITADDIMNFIKELYGRD